MAYSPDHPLAPASAAPSGAPSAIPSGVPSAAPSGPPWPNPLASIAYASCRPADTGPPEEDSALTSRAAYERLNRAAARAETLVLYRLDMLAGCRDSLDVDQTRLEQSIQNLWRLTAVRKTLMSIEAALNAPTPAHQGAAPGVDLQSALAEVRRLLAEVPTESAAPADLSLGARTSSSATAPADQSAPASPESPLPVVLSPSPSCSQSAVALESQSQSCSQSPSATSIPSIGSIGSIGSIESIPPVSKSPSPQVPQSSSPSPRSALPTPHLALRSVPACPRMSLSSVARTLDRVNADMAQYTEFTFTADYGANVTAEEFLRPSAPRSASVVAPTDDEDTILLADPGLSPSLKTQISTRNPSEKARWAFETAVRNTSSCPQVSKSPCPPVSPSPCPPAPRPPD